jgi:hypothetical protein
MLDSLVRVSRRVDWVHFVSILTALPAGRGLARGHGGTSMLSSPWRGPSIVTPPGNWTRLWVTSVTQPAQGRRAVTAGTSSVSQRPAHLPATCHPGHVADADQHSADDAWPRCRAQVISTPAALPPSGSLSAISSPFNSLFKVLFIFPSRYLFAIGLLPVFSFRWNLPPVLG